MSNLKGDLAPPEADLAPMSQPESEIVLHEDEQRMSKQASRIIGYSAGVWSSAEGDEPATPTPEDNAANNESAIPARFRQYLEKLAAYPYYESNTVDPDIKSEIPSYEANQRKYPEVMATCVNEKEGVRQDLVGVIKAGGELFGIVSVSDASVDREDSGSQVVVSRFDKFGERASWVKSKLGSGEQSDADEALNVVTDLFVVGRSTITDSSNQPASPEMSRDHFAVEVAEDGSISVTDRGSTNGTVLYTAKPELDAETLASGDMPKNPTDNFKSWSIRSHQLKVAI